MNEGNRWQLANGMGRTPQLVPSPSSSSFIPQPNSYILYGALVGGPDDQDQYEDNCADFSHGEVSTHGNAVRKVEEVCVSMSASLS